MKSKRGFLLTGLIILIGIMLYVIYTGILNVAQEEAVDTTHSEVFSLGHEEIIMLKNDEVLLLDLEHKIDNSPSNLNNIKVSYDLEGYSSLDNVGVAVNSKTPSILMISPPEGGWYADVDYYLVLDQSLKLAGNKSLDKTITKVFRVDNSKRYTISGKLSMPEGMRAPHYMRFSISAINCNDPTNVIHNNEVRFHRGEAFVNYRLELPENKSGYYIHYELISGNKNYFDFFYEKGYVGASSTVEKKETAKKHFFDKSTELDIPILEVKEVCDSIRRILSEEVKPDMSDYEKISAIYQYIQKNVAYDTAVFNSFKDNPMGEQYTGDLLSHALVGKKAVCMGVAIATQSLLAMSNIDSDIRHAQLLDRYYEVSHAWNVVKLDGKYYNLDATPSAISNAIARVEEELPNRMVFSEEHLSSTIKYIDEKEVDCYNYDYDSGFYDYWQYNKDTKGVVRKIKGIVRLPEGEKAPKGGMFVYIGITVGSDTKDKRDDFENRTTIFIPEGESNAPFKLTAVSTDKTYLLAAKSKKYGEAKDRERVFFSEYIEFDVQGSKEYVIPDVVLEEAMYIQVEVTLPDAKIKSKEDILLLILAEEYDGTPIFEINNKLYGAPICIAKGTTAAAFKLAVPKYSKLMLLSYEIVNSDSRNEYETTAYLGLAGSSADYDKALKIDVNSLKEKYLLKLIKK